MVMEENYCCDCEYYRGANACFPIRFDNLCAHPDIKRRDRVSGEWYGEKAENVRNDKESCPLFKEKKRPWWKFW
jgi:hypothetical protein